jgi:hypothetical protein
MSVGVAAIHSRQTRERFPARQRRAYAARARSMFGQSGSKTSSSQVPLTLVAPEFVIVLTKRASKTRVERLSISACRDVAGKRALHSLRSRILSSIRASVCSRAVNSTNHDRDESDQSVSKSVIS